MSDPIFDIDLDLDIQKPTYNGPIYTVQRGNCAAVRYTYDNPDIIYTAYGEAAVAVIRRLTDEALIQLSIEQEILRYATQQEIGRRQIGPQVDAAAARFFHIGQLEQVITVTNISQETLDQLGDDLDDLEL